MKKILQMSLGVMVGVIGVLLFTLNIWGSEWYKVIISTFGGVILGLFVADYQEACSLIIRGIKLASKIVKSIQCRSKHNFNPKFNSSKFFKKLHFSRIIWIEIVSVFTVAASEIIYLYVRNFFSDPLLPSYSSGLFFVMSFIFLLCTLFFVFPLTWISFCPENVRKMIWGSDHEKLMNGVEKTKVVEMINNVSFFLALVKSVSCGIVGFFTIVISLLFVVYTLIVWIFSIILGIITFPLYIIREISSYSWSLLLSLSVVLGGLIGTLSASYLLGVVSGLGSLFLLSVIEKILKKTYLNFFFSYRQGLPQYLTFRAWD